MKSALLRIQDAINEQARGRHGKYGTLEARHRLPVSSKDSNKTYLLHLGPGPRKEGGVFNRLGGKERSASARSISRHRVPTKREHECNHGSIILRHGGSLGTGGHSESETPWTVRKETLAHLVSGISISKDKDAQSQRTSDRRGDGKDHFNCPISMAPPASYDRFENSILGKLSPKTKPSRIGGDTSYKQRDGESWRYFMKKIQKHKTLDVEGARNDEDPRIYARYNPPECQAFIEKIRGHGRNVQGDTFFCQGELTLSHSQKKSTAS
ncbi:hypothetical protein Tco_0490862 [Tanacetum coccineum]